jgi:hypothetical protein
MVGEREPLEELGEGWETSDKLKYETTNKVTEAKT